MRSRLLLPSLALFLPSLAPLAHVASAQSFTPVREQKNLSPAAVERLHTLETLNALPAGAWRFHAGDIPHGESPTLDDSSWPTVEPRAKAPKDAVWYRREITVPQTLNGYDLTGSRIWFQFRADANGPMPQIIYFNGRRVALGDDLEPIVLFQPAKPGDKILVAVKLLHTVDDKTFSGVNLRIDPNPEATAATARPNPDDIRIQCIAAANLLTALPKPHPELLPRVEEAVDAIDLNALTAGNQAAFDASLRKSQQILGTLHDVLAEANVGMAGNAHIDAAWLWPRSETIDVVRRTFTTALQLMDEYPDYTFSQSAAQYTEWIADKYPDLNKQIAQRVKEGRWEIVGGMWVEPDLNIPDGESLVRQLLVGQRYFQKQYGVTARIGWNPDSFGYNWQLPQIYKRSGLDYFVTQKMHWNDTNQLPFRLFWWQSPDGSKVLTYFPTDYVHDNVNPTRISADFAESAQRNPGTTHHLDLYGIGDHGGGPTRAMLDQADRWIAASKQPTSAVPTLHYGTAQQYFTAVESKLNPTSPTWDYDSIARGYTTPPASGDLVGLPTWNSELYFEYHRGVFTSQAAHKRNIRTSETATLDAEKFSSFAWLLARNQAPNILPEQHYPATELTENWKQITFNQFHDLAAGSGIAVIYRDAQKDFNEVSHTNHEITHEALANLTATADTRVKNGEPIVVFNPSPWTRSEVVRIPVQLSQPADHTQLFDANNKPIATSPAFNDPITHRDEIIARVEDVPALGYRVLHAGPSPKHSKDDHTDLKADETDAAITLSNSKLKFTVDKHSGCITSIVLTSTGKEFLAPNACGNQLQAFADNPKNYDAWNVDPGTLDKPPAIIPADSVRILDRGPVRATVYITRPWQSSKFTQSISLDTQSDVIRIASDIDWHESHVLLKAAFPLAASSAKATYEIPYGSIDRPTTRDNTFSRAQFEVPALRWADLGDEHQGLSLLNDSKYGYDALGNTLRLTLLRSPTWPDPDADRGTQRFTYALYPHAGTWKSAQTVRRGYELNDPLHAEQTFSHTGTLPATHSFASVENPNVTLTAIKKAEDSDALVFRMYEWAGKSSDVKIHVPAGASYAVESNLMEKPEGPHLPLAADTVTIPIKPYEILTIQVSYPQKN